jgi:hypothetical protein
MSAPSRKEPRHSSRATCNRVPGHHERPSPPSWNTPETFTETTSTYDCLRLPFPLLAGTLLLFPSKGDQKLFEMSMKRTRYQPAGGYRTDFADAAQEVPDHDRT